MARTITRSQLLLCLSIVYFMASCCLAQPTARAERLVLENGLTVVLSENHRESQVAVESFYRAGFIHEPRGKAHIAHVVEHMVCCCPTASYGPRQAFELLQKKGMANAETLSSFVHYDYLLPSSDLELALKIESERLTSIRFSEDILKQEIPKVVQEMDFVQRSPQGGLIKFGLIGLSHAIRFGDRFVPVYGGPSQLTLSDIEQFHRDYYRPETAILTLVGDFDAKGAKELVRTYFGRLSKGQPKPIMEAQITGNLQAKWDLRSDAVYLVYPGMDLSADMCAALILFGNYLNERLWSDVELQGVAKSRFCSNQIYPVGETPFFVFAEARPGISIDAVREALRKTMNAALRDFNSTTFAQVKMRLAYFLQSSLLQSAHVQPNSRYELLLAQEAINLGIKEILSGGSPNQEFLTRLNALDFQAAGTIIRSVISEESKREVVFLSAEGRAR